MNTYYTQTVKDKVKISDVLGLHGIKLNRNGKCCCPFHKEKTASFTVFDEGSIYKCFGCGAYGDVIDLVRKYEDCSFKAAIIWLNDNFVLGLPFRQLSPGELQKRAKERSFEVDMTAIYASRRREFEAMVDTRRLLDQILTAQPNHSNEVNLQAQMDTYDGQLDFLTESMEWWYGSDKL